MLQVANLKDHRGRRQLKKSTWNVTMEIHIKANLDDNGQLQSVSSSCAQAPGGFSPFSIPLPVDGVEVRESKVVNYAVKKDLCNKLDAKVTEISQLILEYQKTKQTLDLALK